jgi:hypothetical protein
MQEGLSTNTKGDAIAQAIKESEIKVVYTTTTFSIQSIRERFNPDSDGSDIIVPEYQRGASLWEDEVKSRFIESLFLNFPIPPILVQENQSGELLYLIDGLQRLGSIMEYLNNELTLTGLDTEKLNGTRFEDLESNTAMKRTFFRKPITFQILSNTNENIDFIAEEIFRRMNYGHLRMSPQERRVSENTALRDRFQQLVTDDFLTLCKISEKGKGTNERTLRRGYEIELIARAFCLYHNFPDKIGPSKFDISKSLDELFKDHKKNYTEDDNYKTNFDKFIKEHQKIFDYLKDKDEAVQLFSKPKKSFSSIRYEGIMVGILWALKQESSLDKLDWNALFDLVQKDSEHQYADHFEFNMQSNGSNALKRVKNRIELVRCVLLDKEFGSTYGE